MQKLFFVRVQKSFLILFVCLEPVLCAILQALNGRNSYELIVALRQMG